MSGETADQVSNPRKGEGSGRASCDAPPKPQSKPKQRSSVKAAKKTGASSDTIERAQTLVEKRPDLAQKVAAGDTTLTNALRVAKKRCIQSEKKVKLI